MNIRSEVERLAGNDVTPLTVAELNHILREQADAVALVGTQLTRSEQSTLEGWKDATATGARRCAPLSIARQALAFKMEDIREQWFAYNSAWLAWWVDTAELALRCAANEEEVYLSRVLLFCPERSPFVSGEASLAPTLGMGEPLQYWGERWINDSLPTIMSARKLVELLAALVDDEHSASVLVAHRAVLDALHAGDLVEIEEESGSATGSFVEKCWEHYETRHSRACDYARAIMSCLQWYSTRMTNLNAGFDQ